MNTNNLLIISGVVIMLGLLSFVIATSAIPTGASVKQPTNMAKAVLTGTTENGDVAIELKPHTPSEDELKVDISVNTHSVDFEI